MMEMVSALVNNVGMMPETFLDCPSCEWLSPRISSGGNSEKPHIISSNQPELFCSQPQLQDESENVADLDASSKDSADFEFRLHDPVTMLPADELFSDGKLVPFQLSSICSPVESAAKIRSSEKLRRSEISLSDPYAISPKAPRCSSRWKELLGLKKKAQSPKSSELLKAAASAVHPSSKNPNPRTLKHFLGRRNPNKSSIDSSLGLPLLRDSDSDASRLSLSSSSSSGHDNEDLPSQTTPIISLNRNLGRVMRRVSKPKVAFLGASNKTSSQEHPHPTVRIGRSPVRLRRAADATTTTPSQDVESPRMNASGKVVFPHHHQNSSSRSLLERSWSSPSSFNGGAGTHKKYCRGGTMPRSYSAGMRVKPVLNMPPVCSLRGSSKSVQSVIGFGQLFSPQKKQTAAARKEPVFSVEA